MIVDLTLGENSKYYENFRHLIRWIEANDKHRNAKNYYNLDKKLHEFDSFELLLQNDNEVIGFSGLYNNGYFPENTARACTRTYYNPLYRNKGLARKERWAESYFIKYELEKSLEKGYSYVFISIQGLKLRRSLENLSNYLEKNTGYKWKVHPHLCNTCRQFNDNDKFIGVNNEFTCWQNVCYAKIRETDTEFELPSKTIHEYKKEFMI